MRAAIISDLHLGAATGRDLLRREEVLAALLAALEDVPELVLLGDVLELREAPVRDVIAAARPGLTEIGNAMAGRTITLVPGNHDHQLAGPLIDRLHLEGRPLEPETIAEPGHEGPLGEVAKALSAARVRLAYPGVWLRDDVYATHGHYLDVHSTIPTFERLVIGVLQRATARVPGPSATPADYEAALSPVYALTYALAQTSAAGRQLVRSDRSAKAWGALASRGARRSLGTRLLGGAAIPAAVAALNAAGLGPLGSDLSGEALRDSGLRSMETVAERLGIDARHIVFGHTHRSGPHPRDAGWGRLVNSGSWLLEPVFLGSRPRESPYFPGHCVLVPEEGPPLLRPLLAELPG